jgi:hypothetical protein
MIIKVEDMPKVKADKDQFLELFKVVHVTALKVEDGDK